MSFLLMHSNVYKFKEEIVADDSNDILYENAFEPILFRNGTSYIPFNLDLLISTPADSPDVALLDEPVDNPSDESNGSGEDWRVTVLEQIKQFSPKKFEIITSKRTDLGKTSSN